MKWDNWESPIHIIQKQIELQQEEQIMEAIQEVGVVVDKEELVRCMQYDRDQYSKGYAQGRADVIEDIKEIFNEDFFNRYAWSDGTMNFNNCSLMLLEIMEQLDES